MPDLIRCLIDGVDRSAYLVGISGMAPAGYGEVGTATLVFKRDATLAYSLQDKQLVEVGVWNGAAWVHREFGGWVSDIDIENTVPAEFLAVGCQDHNLILDTLVSQPLVDLTFPGGIDFDDMVLAVVQQYNATAAKQIDASSQVANLVNTPIMPDVTVPGDSSLREALQLVMDAAQLTDPALRPRFFLGTDNTVSAVFGNAVLYVYDAAVVPAVSFRFTDPPVGIGQKPIFGEFKIKDDGTATRNRRYLTWREDAAVLGEDAASEAAYPAPYSPHNSWMGKALSINDFDDATEAQAYIDGAIAESAYFRRTITFDTIERVRVGMVVGVSWAKEGMVDVGYYVVGVDADYSDPMEPMRTLTLNAAVLEFGEHAGKGAGGLTIPHTPPTPPVHNAPTPLNADGSYGTYDGGTGRTYFNLNWTHSISPQVVDYLADVTFGGSTVRISTGYVNTYPLDLPPNTAFSVVLWAVNMWGQISPISSAAQAGTTQRAPTNMVYNGSMELAVRFHPDRLDGWTTSVAGSSSVTRSNTQAYDMTFCADLDRVASALCNMRSRRIAVDYTRPYTLTYSFYGSAAATYGVCQVVEYGTGDTPATLATETFTEAVTIGWQTFTRVLNFPVNTTQIEVVFANLYAGSAHLYVDAVDIHPQINDYDVVEHGLSPAKLEIMEPAYNLYNGDFRIPSSYDETVADGWTFVPTNAGLGTRELASAVGASVAGKYVYQIDCPGGGVNGGVLVSHKISMADTTAAAVSAAYARYVRVIIQSSAAVGTCDVVADTYDNLDNSIGSTNIGSVSLNGGYQYLDNNFVQSGGAYFTISVQVANDAVNPVTVWVSAVYADEAVITNKIKNLAITSGKIAALSITSSKLAASSVTAGKIATGGISAAAQFAAGVVDATALAAGAVTNVKLSTITDPTKFQFDVQTNPLIIKDNATNEIGRISYTGVNLMYRAASGTPLELVADAGNSCQILMDPSSYIRYTTGTTAIPHKFQNGSIVTHQGALTTTATDGFLYIPTSAGAPTGTPTAQTGTVALEYDTTSNNLYVYNGAWKKVGLA